MRHALVLGGTGFVGHAVVRALCSSGLSVTFTYRRSEGAAHTLAKETDSRALRVDLAQAGELPELLESLCSAGAPTVAVHCAGELVSDPLASLTDEAWERSHAVNARSAFHLCRGLAPAMAQLGGGDIVLVGGLDRAQSLPVPAAYAASQGMVSAFVMAIAKELGPAGVRVNMVALGLLGAGLSSGLSERQKADYLAFSALHRYGTAAEAARVITWLALRNTFVTGKVVSANGGI